MSKLTLVQAVLLTFVSVALLQNCKKTTDPAPDPKTLSLTDAGGLIITVTYDKTPATTDLDLYLYRKSTYSATSNPLGGSIGPTDAGTVSTTIQPTAPDETHTVVVAYKTGVVEKPYTLTFKGVTDKNSITVNSSFAANLAATTATNYFGLSRGNNVTLVKTGNTYTVSQ